MLRNIPVSVPSCLFMRCASLFLVPDRLGVLSKRTRAPNYSKCHPFAHTFLKISPSFVSQISFGPQKTCSKQSNAVCIQLYLALARECYFEPFSEM